jgi:hypothetical protein
MPNIVDCRTTEQVGRQTSELVAASGKDRRALGPTEASRMCLGTSNLGRALVRIFFNLTTRRSTLSVAVFPFSYRLSFALWSHRSKRVYIISFAFFVHLPQHAARFHFSRPFGLQAPFRFPATAAFRTQGTTRPWSCLYSKLIPSSRTSSSVSRLDSLCSTVSTLLPEPSPLLLVPRVAMF